MYAKQRNDKPLVTKGNRVATFDDCKCAKAPAIKIDCANCEPSSSP
jgi:hypothetical protein